MHEEVRMALATKLEPLYAPDFADLGTADGDSQ